jgi:outer membrane immunogenic protein
MRVVSIAAAIGAGLVLTQAVQAQDATPDTTTTNNTAFRGFRAEVQLGGDRFQSQGTHDNKLSWGGAIGFDGVIANKFVVGPEFSYWNGRPENVTAGVTGGTIAHKSFQELGAGIRAGYLVTPKILVYGIGGYVDNEQRVAFSGTSGNGTDGFYDHFHTQGYQLGGGAEYSVMKNLYAGVGYRYSNYDDHTIRQRLYGSVGVRF